MGAFGAFGVFGGYPISFEQGSAMVVVKFNFGHRIHRTHRSELMLDLRELCALCGWIYGLEPRAERQLFTTEYTESTENDLMVFRCLR